MPIPSEKVDETTTKKGSGDNTAADKAQGKSDSTDSSKDKDLDLLSDEELKEYADRKLKDENAKRRIENKRLVEELNQLKAKMADGSKPVNAETPGDDSATKELQAKLSEQEAKLKRQAAQFSFISIAVKKGIADPVMAFKLIDVESDALTIDPDSGEVAGMEALVAKLIKSSPWVLGTSTNQSPHQDVSGPGAQPLSKQTGKNATHSAALDNAMKKGGLDAARQYLAEMRKST